jgi:selenocysteine lyase/cysteine desulfurase
MSHASNVTGAVQDAAAIGKIARESGALFVLDAAQTAGTVAIDMAAMAVDAVAVPGHKGCLGPQGTGALCLARELPVRCWREGGTGSSRALDLQPEEWPARLEAGTGNTGGVLGLLAGLAFLQERGIASVHRHERGLVSLLAEELAPCLRDESIRWIGPPPEAVDRVGVVSLLVAALAPEEVGLALDAHGIAVRTGFHCAPYVHDALGSSGSGTVRVSPGPFTTPEEIVQAAGVLRSLAGRAGG